MWALDIIIRIWNIIKIFFDSGVSYECFKSCKQIQVVDFRRLKEGPLEPKNKTIYM